MDFIEAREALHRGNRIRHETMPKCEWIEKNRGFNTYLILFGVDDDGYLPDRPLDFCELLNAALRDDDDGWEVETSDAIQAER
ncbi:MAG: hypothetical protein LBD42_03060 [Desulfovibrio sp.]|jgi:hypothetical protein|nr:hypothetical protein [Desulfovibrio sp.]